MTKEVGYDHLAPFFHATDFGADVTLTSDGGHFPDREGTRTQLPYALDLVRDLAG